MNNLNKGSVTVLAYAKINSTRAWSYTWRYL